MSQESDKEIKDQMTEQPPAPEAEPSAGEGIPDTGQPDLVAELTQKLQESEQQALAFKDQMLRKIAEFDNMKRRLEQERLEMIRYANQRLIMSILPIVDDFERSLQSMKESNDPFMEGIKLIHQKMMKSLEIEGVKPFDSVGKPFDVHYHDALMQESREEVEPMTVLQEFEKGYMYHDRVIRHAKVKVSIAPPEELASGTNNDQ